MLWLAIVIHEIKDIKLSARTHVMMAEFNDNIVTHRIRNSLQS